MAISSKYKRTLEELRQSNRGLSSDELWKQARFDLNSSGEYIRCKEAIKTAVIAIIKSGAATTLSASDLKGMSKASIFITKKREMKREWAIVTGLRLKPSKHLFSHTFGSEYGTKHFPDALGSQDYIESVLCDLYAKLKTQVEEVVRQQSPDNGLAGCDTTSKVDYGCEQMAKLAMEAAAVGDSELANVLFLENTARNETNPGNDAVGLPGGVLLFN